MNETETFQHYRVLRRADGSVWELGRGSMGVTYKAFDTDLHCEVALKVILPQILHNEDSRGRFLREARLAARLRHPNIAAIFHLGRTADETHFYAMEFCEGETLQQIVEQRGPFEVAAALAVVLQISRALVLANEHQLVHRDIKPANLILTDSPADGPTVKIIDFGLAKSNPVEGSTWASMGTSGFVGTAHFASPEQLENEPVDGRSDIYSLGATLWFLLTGRSMFGGSLARIISQHLSAPVPWPQLEGRNVPPSVRALLARTLEKKPADRFANALELKRAVEDCLAGLAGGSVARPVAVPAGGPVEAPASGDAGVVLAGRWQLVEKCGGGATGQWFRAVDLREQGRPLAVKILDGRIAADLEVCRRLERTVKTLRAAPHENLIQPLAFGKDGAGGRFLVMEWIEGFTLLAVLRARGAVTLPEALRLLAPLAAGFDHARRHGLTRLEWSNHQILVGFPEGFDDEQQRERTLHLPLAAWPPFRVALGALPLERPVADGDDTLAGLQTRLPAPAEADAPAASGEGPAAGLEVSALGRLIYELLGGAPTAPAPGSSATRARYVPLARLTEAGNAVLRRAVRPAADDPGFRTAREFHDALENTVGHETARPATTRPGAPVPLAVELPGDNEGHKTSPGSRWPWLAVPVLLAVVGAAAYLGAGHSSPPARSSRATPPPTVFPSRPAPVRSSPPALVNEVPPTPPPPAVTTQLPPVAVEPPPPLRSPEAAATPGVIDGTPTLAATTPAPLPPLEGKLEHAERSPLGDLRLEHRRTDAGDSVWLIPPADESRRRLLDKFPGDAQVIFSPDEKWLLVNDHPDKNGGGAQLYRRTGDDETLYAVPEAFRRPDARVEDLAWGFYLAEVGLPPDASRDHVHVDAVAWEPDSSAFTVRIDSFGPGGTDTVPVPWLCRYEPASGHFRAVTDIHEARNAIAARARDKARPAAASPPPAARPAGDWQKPLGDFVDGFVRCDQTRDVGAALAYYAPVVDYFAEGRVNQAYIRNDVLKFNQRWPVQRNSIIGKPDLREIKPGQSYSARFHLAYAVESAPRKAWARGEFALEMNVEVVRGVPLIVSIREKAVRRENGKLPGRRSGD